MVSSRHEERCQKGMSHVELPQISTALRVVSTTARMRAVFFVHTCFSLRMRRFLAWRLSRGPTNLALAIDEGLLESGNILLNQAHTIPGLMRGDSQDTSQKGSRQLRPIWSVRGVWEIPTHARTGDFCSKSRITA